MTSKLRGLIGDREVSMTKEYLPVTRLVVEISGATKIPGVEELVASAPHPVVVSYVNKPGIEEVDLLLRAATVVWKKAFPQILRTTVDDSDPNRILVVVKPGSQALQESLLRELAPAIPTAIEVSVSEEREGDAPTLDSKGGLRLNISGNSGSTGVACTSGFMGTKDTTGTKVLITAAH